MKKIYKISILFLMVFLIRSITFSQNRMLDKNIYEKKSESINEANLRSNGLPVSVKTILPKSDGASSVNGRAPQGSRKYIKNCYLIRPFEMDTSEFGIKEVASVGWTWIAFRQQSLSTTGILKVYLQNTSHNVYSKGTSFSNCLVGMTKVIEGTITIPDGEGTYSIDIPVGGPGTSTFSTIDNLGLYVAFEYETTTAIATPLGAPTVFCNIALISGIGTYQSQIVNGNLLTLSSQRPETRLGTTDLDTVEVTNIYALGKIPYPWGFPDSIGIRISKNVPGRITEVNVRMENRDPPFQENFDSTFFISNPSNYVFTTFIALPVFKDFENDLVIVKAIPGDVLDNTFKYCHSISPDSYNHMDTCVPNDGGVGFTGSTGNFVAGFHNYSSQPFPIYAIDQCFFDSVGGGGKSYQIIIHLDDGFGNPGPILYISPFLVTPVGNGGSKYSTFNLFPPVTISPNRKFFVGYRQNIHNISACFQDEIPLRIGSFFYSIPGSSTTWIDFAYDSAFYRLDIAARTCVNLNLKAYLEGFYNGSIMIPEKVVVELRNFTSPYSLVDTDTSKLNSDGTGVFTFPNLSFFTNYYFVVRHRNHIETWSHAIGESFDSCGKYYDFTDAITKAYGNNLVHISSLDNKSTGGYAVYVGDVNQDGTVDGTDYGDVDNDAYSFKTGYIVTDLNGDEIVDASDAALVENNVFNFVSVIRP